MRRITTVLAVVSALAVLVPASAVFAKEGGGAGRDRFTLVGELVDVGEDQLVVAVRAGKPRSVRGTEVTVEVADEARIRREGPAELADLVEGDKVVVRGRRVDGAYVASRVNARPAGDAEPSPSPSPSPTA